MHPKGLWVKARAAVVLAPWKRMTVANRAALRPALLLLGAGCAQGPWAPC